MPTITISNDQAAALARGEDITVPGNPPEDIHNCIVFTTSRSSYYVWDGTVYPNGRVCFWRYQQIIDCFGSPVEHEVETRKDRDYRDGSCFVQRANVRRIVPVGR